MTTTELLSNTEMHLVPKGRNLHAIGWHNGYMVVIFKTSRDRWVYGPQIPEVEKDKLLRVPYPDKLFTGNIKAKFNAYKVKL